MGSIPIENRGVLNNKKDYELHHGAFLWFKTYTKKKKENLFSESPTIFNELYCNTLKNLYVYLKTKTMQKTYDNWKNWYETMKLPVICDVFSFYFLSYIQPPIFFLIHDLIRDHLFVMILAILIFISISFYNYLIYSYNWTTDLIMKMKTRYLFYKNWRRPKRKPQKWHPLKQDIVNFIRFRILHKIMTRETFMVLLYIFLGFVILFWAIFFRVKYLIEFIHFVSMRHWRKIKNNNATKMSNTGNTRRYSSVKPRFGACERVLGLKDLNNVRMRRTCSALNSSTKTQQNFELKKNTLFTNSKSKNIGDNNNKTNNSWKQLLILRLCVFFGLLIFLLFSYLLNESFDMNKIHSQFIIFLNDKDWSKTSRLISRCWHNYISIWDYQQWTVSIIGIIPTYWFLFDLLFWVKLIDKPFTPSQKIFFISTDLFLNFVVGFIYMAYPRTIIGALMYKCPVALSPYFIIIEISVYLLFRAWLKYKENKTSTKL